MNPSTTILVVGASVASGSLVSQLRADGFAGRIVVVDQDPDAPYDRPPLSKEFLAGDTLRPEAPWWDERCEFVRGRATALNIGSSTVPVAADGGSRTIGADHIVIATGSAPVSLPGQPPGVAQLRTAEDARLIRQLARPESRLIIIGAGTIGTELASSLIDARCAVSLVDLAGQPLERFLGGHLGDASARWITDAGVALYLGSPVKDIASRGDGWLVTTESGQISGDVVISALGIRPATQWLADSGLDVTDGIRCDSDGAALDTSGKPMPNVHAIGDVSAWCARDMEPRRREDWTSAGRQGRHLARHLLGLNPSPPFDRELAYFWSHQFGRRIQVLGYPVRDATLVQHVDAPDRRAAFYTLERGSETMAWIAINTPKEFAMAMRKSIQATG